VLCLCVVTERVIAGVRKQRASALQATAVAPCRELQRAADLLSTVHVRTAAIAAAHMRLAAALVASCVPGRPDLATLLRALYFEPLAGAHAVAPVLTSYAAACMDAASEDVVAAVLALTRLACDAHGAALNCAVALRPVPQARLPVPVPAKPMRRLVQLLVSCALQHGEVRPSCLISVVHQLC
jgi:hypothetical protein